MATASKAAVVYVQDKQKPAERRLGLNLMINMLSQTTNTNGEKFLPEWVYHLAEVLIMIGEYKVPSKKMVKSLLMKYNNVDIPTEDLRQLITALSDDVFDESSAQDSRAKSRDQDLTDSDSDDQDRRPYGQVQVKAVNLNKLLDKILQTPGVAEVDKEREELISKKLMEAMPKLEKGHVVALFRYHAMSKESTEDQGRAASNIMKSIDLTMQSLIVFPHADTMNSQAEIQKVLGSFTLVCLMKNIYGNDWTAIEPQFKQFQIRAAEYGTAGDMQKYKRDLLTELALYRKLVQLLGRKQDLEKKKSEHEFGEILLRAVYKEDPELAKILRVGLDATLPLTLEELLDKLVENRKIEEGLGEAKSGSGSTKSSDKKGGKQSIANPAIQQQQLKCTSCGSEHDISQCPKEKARLQREAKQRGEKLPGPERSTRRGNRQADQSTEQQRIKTVTFVLLLVDRHGPIILLHAASKRKSLIKNYKTRSIEILG